MLDILFIAEARTEEFFLEKIIQHFSEIHDITLDTHILLLGNHGHGGGLRGDIIDEISTHLLNYQYTYAITMLDLDDLGRVKDFQEEHDRVYSKHKNSHDRSIELEQYLTEQIALHISKKSVDNIELKQVRNKFTAYIQPYVGDCLVLGQLDLYFKIFGKKHKEAIITAINNQRPEDIRKSVIKENILTKKHLYAKPPKKFIEQCNLRTISQFCPHFAQNMLHKIDTIYQKLKIEKTIK